MEETKKNSHGGARPGSGRKRTSVKTYAFRAPQDIVDILEGKNISEYVCAAIRAYKG